MILKFDAAVFDMDGTLVDSMPTWRKMNRDIFYYYHQEVPAELEDKIEKISSREICDYLNEHGISDLPRSEQIFVYEKLMRSHYLNEIEEKPGAGKYLEKLAADGVKMAVYTSTTASLACEALEKQGFLKYFDFVWDTRNTGSEKSEAAGYLKVSEKLEILPEKCVMHEDAPYAMEGARKAGYRVIGIRDFNNLEEPNNTRVHELSDIFAETFYELL